VKTTDKRAVTKRDPDVCHNVDELRAKFEEFERLFQLSPGGLKAFKMDFSKVMISVRVAKAHRKRMLAFVE
jgi:hypothetical protein